MNERIRELLGLADSAFERSGVHWALCGDLAAIHHGANLPAPTMPAPWGGRTPECVDLCVAYKDDLDWLDELRGTGFTHASSAKQSGGPCPGDIDAAYVHRDVGGLRICLTWHPWRVEAIERAVDCGIGAQPPGTAPMPMFRAEDCLVEQIARRGAPFPESLAPILDGPLDRRLLMRRAGQLGVRIPTPHAVRGPRTIGD